MTLISDYFNNSFFEQYSNPEVVLVAFFLIFFIFIFTILIKLKVFDKNQRGVVAIIALVISIMAAYYLPNIYEWTATFNLFLILAVVGLLLFLLKPFLKFIGINLHIIK